MFLKTIIQMTVAALFAMNLYAATPSADDLIAAVNAGDSARVKELIAARVNVNSTNAKGETPLYAAASTGSPEITGLLLKAGANVNGGNSPTVRPLVVAIRKMPQKKEYGEVVDTLLANGADVNTVNKSGESYTTPLATAASTGQLEMAKRLLALGAQVNAAMKNVTSALHMAAYKNDLDMVRLLLDNGADVNQTGMFGSTPIFAAVENGTLDMVKLMVAKGARMDLADSDDFTLLAMAMRSDGDRQQGNSKPHTIEDIEGIVAFLLDNGLDANAVPKSDPQRDFVGVPPLMQAVFLDNERVIRMLVAKGARLNDTVQLQMTDEDSDPGKEMLDGSTALMLAVIMDRKNAAKTLLSLGADPSVRTRQSGFNVAMLAYGMEKQELSDMLALHGMKPSDAEKKLARTTILKLYLSELENALRAALSSAQSAIARTPSLTLLTDDDLQKAWWSSGDEIEIGRVNCSKNACEIVLLHTKMKSGTSPVEGLQPGEGRISSLAGQEKLQLPAVNQ